MRNVVVTQSHFVIDKPTETFLFSGLDGLHRECDSLRSCRVHLQGGDSVPGRSRPFSVTLSLSTGEYHINVRSSDPTHNALTARDAIRSALSKAANELRTLRLSSQCLTCSDRSTPIGTSADFSLQHGRAA